MDASQPNNHGFARETAAGPQQAKGKMEMDICALEPLPTRSKKRIGEPLILPNGIGINYATRFGESLTPSLPPDSGYSSVTNTDSKSPSLAKCTPEPHDALSSLPPRHRHPKNRQFHSKDGRDEDMLVDRQTVTLHHLLPEITIDGLRTLLKDIGFTAPFVIKSMEDHSISLEFSHSNIATVAFSLLQHRAASLFARPSGSISSARLFRPYIIDLTKAETTEDTVNNLTASKSCPPALPDSDDIYGDIGAYDDSGVETTDSEASVTSVREIQRSSASSPKYHSRSENEGPGKTLLPPDSRPRVVNRLPNGLHAVPQPPNWASISIPKTLRDASASPSPLPLAPDKENNEPHIQIVHLPRAAHNRARRVLLPNNSSLPIMTVSMRADFQFFHRTARYRISRYSMPNNYSDRRHTSDAVMIGDFAAVGYRSSPCQVSVIHSREGRPPSFTELDHKPHLAAHNTHAAAAMSGVNCLAAKRATANAIQFFTGGYDKIIRLWSVTTPDLAAQTERLTTLSTIPHALAFRDRMLLVGTSKKILALDLGHLSAKPIAAQLSNSIHQIHVHKQAPNVIVLEVDSLDSQIQLFDVRKQRGFDRTPDCNFGARCGGSRSIRSMSRGDSEYSLFAKGFADGIVRIWDYRNSKQPVLTKAHQNMGAVVHTIFTGSGNILCYNGDSLIFVDSREGAE